MKTSEPQPPSKPPMTREEAERLLMAKERGALAFRRGFFIAANPYPKGSNLAAAWRLGYVEARDE